LLKFPPLFRRGGKGEIALKNISLSLRRGRVRVREEATSSSKEEGWSNDVD
jgi:hypothetical protein